ncbi:MAG: hypothetical protein ACFB00_04770 [Parvularculaceae bacterium]
MSATLTLGEPAARYDAEPDLAVLLRSMAVLKLAFLGPLAAFVWTRLSRPVTARRAGAYVAVVASGVIAFGLIFQLSAVGAGAALFHGALASFVVLAWREPDATIETLAILFNRRRSASRTRG